jgi:hypothetical protein
MLASLSETKGDYRFARLDVQGRTRTPLLQMAAEIRADTSPPLVSD